MRSLVRSLLSIASFLLLFYSGQVFAAESVGHVSYQSGDAWIISESGKRELKLGSEVFPSEIVVTGEKGWVKLAMNDNSHIYISQKSRMEINSYDVQGGQLFKGLLKMVWGKARFLVETLRGKESSFTVSTTTAVIGVRGTEFSVDVPTPQNLKPREALKLRPTIELPTKLTTLMLFEGAVVGRSLKSGAVKMIKPGQLVRFQHTGKISVRKFTKADVKALNIKAIKRTPLKRGNESGRLEKQTLNHINNKPIFKSPAKGEEGSKGLPKGDSKLERPVSPVKTSVLKTPAKSTAPVQMKSPAAPVKTTAPVRTISPTAPTAPVRTITPTAPTAPVKSTVPVSATPVPTAPTTVSTVPIAPKTTTTTAPTVSPIAPNIAPTTVTTVPVAPKTTTIISPTPLPVAPIDSTRTLSR